MEYSNETFKANLLAYKDDDRSGLALYGGYILAVDEGHIRVEVYKKGRYFYCYLNHLMPWGDPGWVVSDKCCSFSEAVTHAILKAGYSHPEIDKFNAGYRWLTTIGREFGDNYRIFSFGSTV